MLTMARMANTSSLRKVMPRKASKRSPERSEILNGSEIFLTVSKSMEPQQVSQGSHCLRTIWSHYYLPFSCFLVLAPIGRSLNSEGVLESRTRDVITSSSFIIIKSSPHHHQIITTLSPNHHQIITTLSPHHHQIIATSSPATSLSPNHHWILIS